MSPLVRNADQTQKNQTKEVANNDESDTADAINEREDLPKNTKMPTTRNVQQENSSAIQEQKKMKNHTSNRIPKPKIWYLSWRIPQ